MPKQRVNLCLPPEQWQRVKERARRQHVSAAQVVSDALDQAFAQEERQKQERMAAVERLLALDLGPMGTPEELRELIAEAAQPRGAEGAPL